MLSTVIGWAGALCILTGYALLSRGVLENDDIGYHLLNLAGATGLTHIGTTNRDWPSVALNAFYALIAIIALSSLL